ncbi:FecR family protein [Pontibacter silvestris]|uniref:FecR family protein n=1 Tax=Pontibacter silvestris TaxID=2305183 RepID=A0ABW4X1P9_9BACT|nr:FecR domain-containing protein [Pontibacter silvestris]MCC9138850.1 FecR domain-containing protein [Pontibacter silvestris]
MQPEKEQLSLLLEKYLQGEATQEEAKLLQKWLRQLNVSEQQALHHFSDEEVRLRMRQRIHARIRPEATPFRKLNPFPTWLRAVAASILLLLSAFLGYRYYTSSDSPATTLIAADGNAMQKVTLPDGTVVMLNRYSTLELDEDYNKEERKVRLIGEAFFDVKKDSRRPFIVNANNTSTRVLGTAFNVESYEGEEQVRVALLRGKVKVEGDNRLQYGLSPGQMLVYDRAERVGRVLPIAEQQIAGWLQHKIIFNDVSLQDAIHRFHHLHQLNIQIDPTLTLEGKRVTGEYGNDEAEQALKAILLLHNMKLKKEGGTLVITGNE